MRSRSLDVALLVPFQPRRFGWVDPVSRSAFAPMHLATTMARDRCLEWLGAAPEGREPEAHRSLTAVVLATSLERAGLGWRVLDPGVRSLAYWRQEIERLSHDDPKVIGISSTFIQDAAWLGTLCEVVRRKAPRARLVIGGYYYANDAERFLSFDADVLCVGEGERRIVEIVRAIRDGGPLEEIPGLYIRDERGRLRYTGDAPPLALDELPLPDWTLSRRIEPSVEPERDVVQYCLETQRGCIFKCEFCTYRTLAAPAMTSADFAVRALRSTAGHRGSMFLIDPTATIPRERFVTVLERLASAGGCPLPTSLYARVSDLDDEVCGLMARAGITQIGVGQESGDQGMLNLMRKGTRADQIRPAVDAMGRHGLTAVFCFLLGFPGETLETLRRTRELICAINDGHEAAPVVRFTSLSVFDLQSFAAVSQRESVQGVRHKFGYEKLEVSPARASEERVTTWLELARIPHAPATGFGSGMELWPMFDERREKGDPLARFRWTKTLDRALAVFVERALAGRPSPRGELGSLRSEILEGMGDVREQRAVPWLKERLGHRLTWRVLGTWARGETTPGLLTRAALGWEVVRATGSARDALEAVRTGDYPPLGILPGEAVRGQTAAHAEQLVQLGIATGRRRLARAR